MTSDTKRSRRFSKRRSRFGQDTDKSAVNGHRQARNVVALHDCLSLSNRLIGLDRDWVGDHTTFVLLDLSDLFSLGR